MTMPPKTMPPKSETFVERRVTYTLEHDGRVYIIENVPARVDEQTGEPYFAPATVEQLQRTVWGEAEPDRVVETPVYDFGTASA
jgi:hypothetical protein